MLHRSPAVPPLAVLLALAAALAAADGAVARPIDAGTCRDPGCKPVCGPADQERLRALIAELRQLRQQADFIRADYDQKHEQRRDAGSRLMGCGATDDPPSRWCGGGSIKSFFSGMGGLLSELPGVGQAYGAAMDVTDVVTSPTQWESWAGGAAGALASDEVGSAMMQRACDDARQAGETYLKATGDTAGAQDIFLRHMKDTSAIQTGQAGAKLFSVGLSLYQAADGAASFGGDLGDWYYAGKEEAALEAQLDRIDARIEDLLKDIAAIRARCHDPTLGPGSPTPGGAPGARVAESGAPADGMVTNAAPDTGAEARDSRSTKKTRDFLPRARRALDRLGRLETHLERMIRRLEADVFPPFAPLVVDDLWRRMSPALVRALARRGAPHLRATRDDAQRAMAVTSEIETILGGGR